MTLPGSIPAQSGLGRAHGIVLAHRRLAHQGAVEMPQVAPLVGEALNDGFLVGPQPVLQRPPTGPGVEGQQIDPGETGCPYAGEVLLPTMRRHGRFVDQEAFDTAARSTLEQFQLVNGG